MADTKHIVIKEQIFKVTVDTAGKIIKVIKPAPEIYKITMSAISGGAGGGLVSFNLRTAANVIPTQDDYTFNQLDFGVSNITKIVNRSHTDLQDIGTRTHDQIDGHLALINAHINWTSATASIYTSGAITGGVVIGTSGLSTPLYIGAGRDISLGSSGGVEDAKITMVSNGKTGILAFDGTSGADGEFKMDKPFSIKDIVNINTEPIVITGLQSESVQTVQIIGENYTSLLIKAADGGGTDRHTATIKMEGYGSRATGIFHNQIASTAEWFVGKAYNSSQFIINWTADNTAIGDDNGHPEDGTDNDRAPFFNFSTDGNFGIGVRIPTKELHVVGDALITGELTVGSFALGDLQADGNLYVNYAGAISDNVSYIYFFDDGSTATGRGVDGPEAASIQWNPDHDNDRIWFGESFPNLTDGAFTFNKKVIAKEVEVQYHLNMIDGARIYIELIDTPGVFDAGTAGQVLMSLGTEGLASGVKWGNISSGSNPDFDDLTLSGNASDTLDFTGTGGIDFLAASSGIAFGIKGVIKEVASGSGIFIEPHLFVEGAIEAGTTIKALGEIHANEASDNGKIFIGANGHLEFDYAGGLLSINKPIKTSEVRATVANDGVKVADVTITRDVRARDIILMPTDATSNAEVKWEKFGDVTFPKFRLAYDGDTEDLLRMYGYKGNGIYNWYLTTWDTANDRVGINKAYPEYALDVTGKINASSAFLINGLNIFTLLALKIHDHPASDIGPGKFKDGNFTQNVGNWSLSNGDMFLGGELNAESYYIRDTRDIETVPGSPWLPDDFNREYRFEFKRSGAVEAPPNNNTYGTLLTMAPWSDSSGGSLHQMFFNDIGGIEYRIGQKTGDSKGDNFWEGWRTLFIAGGDVKGGDLYVNTEDSPNSSYIYFFDDSATSEELHPGQSGEMGARIRFDRVHNPTYPWDNKDDVYTTNNYGQFIFDRRINVPDLEVEYTMNFSHHMNIRIQNQDGVGYDTGNAGDVLTSLGSEGVAKGVKWAPPGDIGTSLGELTLTAIQSTVLTLENGGMIFEDYNKGIDFITDTGAHMTLKGPDQFLTDGLQLSGALWIQGKENVALPKLIIGDTALTAQPQLIFMSATDYVEISLSTNKIEIDGGLYIKGAFARLEASKGFWVAPESLEDVSGIDEIRFTGGGALTSGADEEFPAIKFNHGNVDGELGFFSFNRPIGIGTDQQLKADTINESTTNAGTTINDVLIKDGAIDKLYVGLSNVPNLNTTDAVNNEHNHLNGAELDKITDGYHEISEDNPHNVNKADVGLGSVLNALQVRKATHSFTEDFSSASDPLSSSVVLIQALTGSLKYTSMASMPISIKTQAELDLKINIGEGGSGNVAGPASSADGTIVLFDGTTGKIIQDSGVAGADLSQLHAHSNSAQLDLITDGDHDIRVDNPHGVTQSQVGLSSLTNDKQIKNALSSFTGDFTSGASAVSDVVLMQKTTGQIRYTSLGSLPVNTATQTELDLKVDTSTYNSHTGGNEHIDWTGASADLETSGGLTIGDDATFNSSEVQFLGEVYVEGGVSVVGNIAIDGDIDLTNGIAMTKIFNIHEMHNNDNWAGVASWSNQFETASYVFHNQSMDDPSPDACMVHFQVPPNWTTGTAISVDLGFGISSSPAGNVDLQFIVVAHTYNISGDGDEDNYIGREYSSSRSATIDVVDVAAYGQTYVVKKNIVLTSDGKLNSYNISAGDMLVIQFRISDGTTNSVTSSGAHAAYLAVHYQANDMTVIM